MESEEPWRLLKAGSRIISFPGAEVWFCQEQAVLDAERPIPDLIVREFARPRVVLEGRSYYVSSKSHRPTPPVIYRYVLTPWPAADGGTTKAVFLDAEFFQRQIAEQKRSRRERLAFLALAGLYPFLGFLWASPKRYLNRLGFEAHLLSSISAYVAFLIGFLCAVFLVIFEFGAKALSLVLLLGAAVFLADAVARFHRLLRDNDPIPPGFLEWLIRPRERYE
jgi:hypothetical protein